MPPPTRLDDQASIGLPSAGDLDGGAVGAVAVCHEPVVEQPVECACGSERVGAGLPCRRRRTGTWARRIGTLVLVVVFRHRHAAAVSATTSADRVRGLSWARRWWFVWLLAHAVAFAAGLRRQLELVTEPCEGCPSVFRLTPQRLDALKDAGITLGEYRTVVAMLVGGFALATTALAWMLIRRSRDEVMPVVTGYLLVSVAAARWVEDGALISIGWLSPLGRLVAFGNAVALVVIFGLFPDGRWRPRWAAVTAAVVTTWCGLVYFSPLAGLLASGRDPVASIDAAVFVGSLMAIATAQILRYRSSGDDQRGPIRWVAVALLLAVGVFVPLVLLIRAGVEIVPVVDAVTVAAAIAASFLVIGAIAAAVLRHRLWDVEVVVSRVVVYGGLTLTISVLYVALVAAGSRLTLAWEPALALAAAVSLAVGLQPLRRQLQHLADRMVYGRPPPMDSLLEPLSTLPASDPVAGLARTVEVIGTSLRLPYVALEVAVPDAPPLRAVHGDDTWTTGVVQLPIRVDGERVGHLAIAPRRGQRRLTRGDRDSLRILAAQVSAIAAMVRTTVALQHSRAQLVGAREEERRRIRRDLHDGLGPSLAGLAHRIERIRSAPHGVGHDPRALETVEADLRIALEDVRRLARGLRPPVLDQLGLTGAIEARADELGLQVTITRSAPDELPAAVERAAYLVASEALLNARRHGRATAVCVDTHVVDHVLHLDVTDNGIGLPAEPTPGVGLRSMRERAAELGGQCVVTPVDGCGARVSLAVPLPAGTTS